MSNEGKPLTEAALAAIEAMAGEGKVATDRASLHFVTEVADGRSLPDVLRLVAEVRRLRQLVIDAEPYVPDNDQTRTMDLPARLRPRWSGSRIRVVPARRALDRGPGQRWSRATGPPGR